MNRYQLKIAVQLFGHFRTFEKCAQALKENLLDRYDCDVFIHTWGSNRARHPELVSRRSPWASPLAARG